MIILCGFNETGCVLLGGDLHRYVWKCWVRGNCNRISFFKVHWFCGVNSTIWWFWSRSLTSLLLQHFFLYGNDFWDILTFLMICDSIVGGCWVAVGGVSDPLRQLVMLRRHVVFFEVPLIFIILRKYVLLRVPSIPAIGVWLFDIHTILHKLLQFVVIFANSNLFYLLMTPFLRLLLLPLFVMIKFRSNVHLSAAQLCRIVLRLIVSILKTTTVVISIFMNLIISEK